MKTIILLILSIIAITITACNQKEPEKKPSMNQNNTTTKLHHPDWTKNTNIYEVNIRQYTPEGTFKAFEKHIDRLHDMGVDILWIMPINPIGEKNRKGTLGSYYSIKDYKAVNPEFGNLNDLKDIVDKAHSLGMHVILDWVANHTSWDNIWLEEHSDWYDKDSTGNFESPYDWSDVISLNYDNKNMRAAMIDAMEYWIDSADIDGFRCDVADLVPIDFWNDARKQLDKKKKVFMLAEAETPELLEEAFDMTYAWKLHHLMNAISKSEKTASDLISYFNEQDSLYKRIDYQMIFTSNHDENSWNGTVYERMPKSYKAMAALSYMVPGMPLIYNGQEAGMNKRLSFFDKDEISWDSLKLENFYSTLNEIKHDNKVLWNGEFGGEMSFISTNEKVLIIKRFSEKQTIIFICNFNDNYINVSLPQNLLNEDINVLFSDGKLIQQEDNTLALNPWQFIILKK
jgi:glycosidase